MRSNAFHNHIYIKKNFVIIVELFYLNLEILILP